MNFDIVAFKDTVVAILQTKYIAFDGRASRSEFWYFFLFAIIVNVIANLIDSIIGHTIMFTLAGLALCLPMLSVGARRLHDIDKSGWWQLISLTIIGIVVLIYWYVQPGEKQANRFGPPPVA